MADPVSTAGVLGAGAISAGGGLLGSVVNSVLGNKASKADWQRNYNAQKEFAQNSIQWRVQDAQKAGINPLYAMGNSPGYTPSSSFNNESIGVGIAQAGNAMAEAMGQLQMMQLLSNIENTKADTAKKEAEASVTLGQSPKVIPPVTKTTSPKKAEVTMAPNIQYLNNFARYGDGFIGYPSEDLLDASSEASIFNPLSLPVAIDAFDAQYRSMPEHFQRSIEYAIPGADKWISNVSAERSWSSYGRPVYKVHWKKGTPQKIRDMYNSLLNRARSAR
ncbi:DNA pilot protein [Chicken microvirus mg7_19]|nr:DNA pilot protein [Chicken microvirus mg7_19]